ncbi:hypothetical protein [Geopseudomonas sagittaria]|uniref:hypothetical protein n=1 Tax=Geopseudomonas sagittaria TaxID=1135990 RepID=UPI001113C4A4|nr:hypothetical protein [Pseudomonas sagittaria]
MKFVIVTAVALFATTAQAELETTKKLDAAYAMFRCAELSEAGGINEKYLSSRIALRKRAFDLAFKANLGDSSTKSRDEGDWPLEVDAAYWTGWLAGQANAEVTRQFGDLPYAEVTARSNGLDSRKYKSKIKRALDAYKKESCEALSELE